MSQSSIKSFFASSVAQNHDDSSTLLMGVSATLVDESMGATQVDEHATKSRLDLVDVDSDAETVAGMMSGEQLLKKESDDGEPEKDEEEPENRGIEEEPKERGDEEPRERGDEEPKESCDEELRREERGAKKRKHHDEGKGNARKTAKGKSKPKPEPKAKGTGHGKKDAKKAVQEKKAAKTAKEERLEKEQETNLEGEATEKPKPKQPETKDVESLGIKALLNNEFENFIKEQLGTEFQENNVDRFQRWFAARAEAKQEKAEEGSQPPSDLGFFEKKEFERLQAALATGKIESKSYLGNQYRKHLANNPQEAERYGEASRSEQAQFRLRWAQATFGKFEEGKKQESSWSRVDTTRGCYMNLARLVVHLGGWSSAEARSGALCAAQKCAAMGSPWLRVNDQTSLCEFLIMETSWSETFRSSWSRWQRSWTTGELKGGQPSGSEAKGKAEKPSGSEAKGKAEKPSGSEAKDEGESKGNETKGKSNEKKGKGSLPKDTGNEAKGEATSQAKRKSDETKGKGNDTKGKDNETKGQSDEGKSNETKGKSNEAKGKDNETKRHRQDDVLDHNLLWRQAEKLKVQFQQSSSTFLAIKSKIAEDATWAWAQGHSGELEQAHKEITMKCTPWVRNFLMSESSAFRKASAANKAGLELQAFLRDGKPAIDALSSLCSRLTRAHNSLHP